MYVFADRLLTRSVWFHCRNCKKSCDTLHLASLVFGGSSDRATLQSLRKAFPVPKAHSEAFLAEYHKHVRTIERTNQIIEESTTNTALRHPEAFRIANTLKWSYETSLSWFDNRAPLGFLHAEKLNSMLNDDLDKNPRRIVPKEMKHCGIVPFYDLPMRPVGLYIFDVVKGHLVDKFIRLRHAKQTDNIEAGIAIHKNLLNNFHPVLMLDNVTDYIRLSLKSIASDSTQVPLGCWHESPGCRTRHGWQMLHGYNTTLWLPDLSENGVRQAISSGSKLFLRPGQNGRDSYGHQKFLSVPVGEIHSQAFRKASSWPIAVAKFVAKQDEGAAVRTLSELRLSAEEYQQIAANGSDEVKVHVKQTQAYSPAGVMFASHQGEIHFVNDRWLLRKPKANDLVITDAPFLIDKITHLPAADTTEMTIRIFFRGEQIVSEFEKRTFERRPFEVIQSKLISLGKGLSCFSSQHQRIAMMVATSFSSPEIINGPARLGYCEETNCLLFHNFRVDVSNGQVHRHGDISSFPRGFLNPEPVSVMDAIAVTSLNEWPSITAMMMLQIKQLMDYGAGIPSVPILCRPDTCLATTAGLFCSSEPFFDSANMATRYINRHGLPQRIGLTNSLSPGDRRQLLQSSAKGLLTLLTSQTGKFWAAMSRDAVFVEARGGSKFPEKLLRPLGGIAFALLSKIYSTGWCNRPMTARTFMTNACQLLQEMGYDAEPGATVLRTFGTGTFFKRCLEQMLITSITRGDFGFKSVNSFPKSPSSRSVYFRKKDGAVFASRQGLVRLFHNAGFPPVDLISLTDRLVSKGLTKKAFLDSEGWVLHGLHVKPTEEKSSKRKSGVPKLVQSRTYQTTPTREGSTETEREIQSRGSSLF